MTTTDSAPTAGQTKVAAKYVADAERHGLTVERDDITLSSGTVYIGLRITNPAYPHGGSLHITISRGFGDTDGARPRVSATNHYWPGHEGRAVKVRWIYSTMTGLARGI